MFQVVFVSDENIDTTSWTLASAQLTQFQVITFENTHKDAFDGSYML